MIETREKAIGGVTYKVTQFPAKQGRSVLLRLTRLVGPSFAGFLDGLGARTELDAALLKGASAAVYELSQRITPEGFAALSDEFAKFTVVVLDGDREPRLGDIFDDHFAGKYHHMLQWLTFSIEVNYSGFFGDKEGLAERFRLLMEKVGSRSKSPKASTGSSTGSQPAPGTPAD